MEPTNIPPEQTLFEGRPAVIASLGEAALAVITLGIAAVFFWLKSISTHYKITTQRIVIEHGILNKTIDQTELYRIRDYRVDLPILQRAMGTGNLFIAALDKTEQNIAITRIKTDVRALYEQLRSASEAEKVRRNVRLVDYE